MQLVASIVATSQGTPPAPASPPAGRTGALPELLAPLPPPEPPEDDPAEGVLPADGGVADGPLTDGAVADELFAEEPAPEGAADSTPVELGAAIAPAAMITCGSEPEPLHAQTIVVMSANGIQIGDLPRLDRGRHSRPHDEKRDRSRSRIVRVQSLSAFPSRAGEFRSWRDIGIIRKSRVSECLFTDRARRMSCIAIKRTQETFSGRQRFVLSCDECVRHGALLSSFFSRNERYPRHRAMAASVPASLPSKHLRLTVVAGRRSRRLWRDEMDSLQRGGRRLEGPRDQKRVATAGSACIESSKTKMTCS